LGEPELAVGYFQGALSRDGSDVGIRLNLGIAYHMAGDADQGDSILDVAIGEAGGFEEALAILGFPGSAGPGLKAAETVTRDELTGAGSGDAPLY
jgi:hypothetical protein